MSFFPQGASTLAGKVDVLFLFVLAVCVFFSLLICGSIIYFSIKYREGHEVDRAKPPSGSPLLELTWSGIPLLISIGIFGWAALLYVNEYQAPADAMQIYVVGKQWMWKLQHPSGRREINNLHVPLGRPVKLLLTSQDVIHSFFVPAFRIKQDALPGRYTSLWFQPTQLGQFHLFCAEYCGTNHSFMGGWITVMRPADYQRWLHEDERKPSMAAAGEKLFLSYGCSGCHGLNSRVQAPPLEGVYGHQVPLDKKQFVVADDAYIRDSILLPEAQIVAGYRPIMPSYKGRISEDELLQIIEYIKSLGTTGAGPAGTSENSRVPVAVQNGEEVKRNLFPAAGKASSPKQ